MKQVTKAVIPAAGFGTRFLPQTKAMPKEMLPVVDRPIIQIVVEELVDAGIKDIIIVSGYSKKPIEDHFDTPNQDLVANLMQGGPSKQKYLEEIENIANMANFIYIRQKGPYGNATPIYNAARVVGDEPFIYTWADDFILSEPGAIKQMIEVYNQRGGSVFSCVKAKDDEDYDRYGFGAGTEVEEGLLKLDRIVEKPGKENSPSDFASVSNYLFQPEFTRYVTEAHDRFMESEQDGEFLMQDVAQQMINDGHDVYALAIKNGKFYDTGNKLEYLKTVIDFGLKDEEIGPGLEAYLRSMIQ